MDNDPSSDSTSDRKPPAPILVVRAEAARLPLPASPEYIALKQSRERKRSESLSSLKENILEVNENLNINFSSTSDALFYKTLIDIYVTKRKIQTEPNVCVYDILCLNQSLPLIGRMMPVPLDPEECQCPSPAKTTCPAALLTPTLQDLDLEEDRRDRQLG